MADANQQAPTTAGRSEDHAVIVEAIKARSDEIVAALRGIHERDLLAASHLPGWSRLTLACHLRYGAEALVRMTADALAGRATAFYPGGRDGQRAATLVPREGETPAGVVEALAAESAKLDVAWRSLRHEDWVTVVREPADVADLGDLTLGFYALLRLTEVEVHGDDLALDLSPWSDVFVDAALPARVEWLGRRRSNHRAVDGTVRGAWVLSAVDGPGYVIEVDPDGQVTGAVAGDRTSDESGGDATIIGTSRQLLALMLGRIAVDELEVRGNTQLAKRFTKAFPGP